MTTMNISSENESTEGLKSFLSMFCRWRKTDSQILLSWKQRISLFIFGMLQNGLCGGLIFGWASIDHSVLSATPEQGGAGLSLHQTTILFSRGTSLSMAAALVLGAILDYGGPRIASVVSCWSVALGCLVFASANGFLGFELGICLIVFGGPGVGNSIIHIANLFPGNENFVISCLTGSIAFSFSVFAVLDILWSAYDWLGYRDLFGVYAITCFLLGTGAIILYPDEPFEEATEEETGQQEENLKGERQQLLPSTKSATDSSPKTHRLLVPPAAHVPHGHVLAPQVTTIIEQPLNSFLRDDSHMYHRTDSYRASRKALAVGKPAVSLKDQPFLNQLLSATYLRAFYIFLVTSFVTNFYVGTFTTELGDRLDYTDEAQHRLSRWFTLIMGTGLLGSLLIGWMIDQCGLEACTATTLFFGIFQILLNIFFHASENLMMVSFVAYTLFRACLYPVFISSITSRLGFKYFGLLLGIGFALSGVAQLLFPMVVKSIRGTCHIDGMDPETCEHGSWSENESIVVIILMFSLIAPYFEHRATLIQEAEVQHVLEV